VKNVQKASGSLLTGVLEGVVWGLGSIVGANKSAQGSDGAIDFGFKRPSTNNLESAASSASSSDVKDDASLHERRDRRTSSEDAEFRCVRMDSKDASDYMSVNRNNNNKPKPGDAMVDSAGGGSGKPVVESKVMVLSTDEDEDWDDWDDNGPNPETTAETTESAPTDGTTENASQDDMVYTASVDTPNEDGMDDDGVAIIDTNEVPTEMSKMSNEVPTSSTTTCIRGHYFNVVQEPEVCEAEHDADPQPTTTTTVIVTEIATTAGDPNEGGGDDAASGSCRSPMVCVSKAITTTTTIAVDPKAEIVDAELAEEQMAGTTTTTTIVVDLVPANEISEEGSSGTNSTGNCSFMTSSGVEVEVPSAATDARAPQAVATDAPVPASAPGPESGQSEDSVDSVLAMNTEEPPSVPMREAIESPVIAPPPNNAVSPAPVPAAEHTTATDKPNSKGQSKQSDDDVVLRTRTRGGAKKK
jgi:hypothetical protein